MIAPCQPGPTGNSAWAGGEVPQGGGVIIILLILTALLQYYFDK